MKIESESYQMLANINLINCTIYDAIKIYAENNYIHTNIIMHAS